MKVQPASNAKSHAVTHARLFWAIVLLGANLRVPITSIGPVLPDIQSDLGLNGLGTGALNALPLVLFAILSPVASLLARRHALERLLTLAAFGILVGTLVRSTPVFGFVWLGTVLLSVGIAFGNVLLPGLMKREFPDRAPGLIGIYAATMACVAGLGAGVAIPLSRLSGSNWRWAIGCWALLALVTLGTWLPKYLAAKKTPRDRTTSARASFRSPWTHPVGWHVSFFFAAHSLVFYALVDWYPSYAMSKGISEAQTGFHMLVYQVVAVSTNLGCATLMRRLRDQKLLGFVCGLALVIGTAGLLVAPGIALVWLICAGLGAGIAMVTSLSLFALRTRDHQQAASLSGMAQFVGYLGAAAGPLLVGILHDVTNGWSAPLAFLVLISVAVAIFATLAGRHRNIC